MLSLDPTKLAQEVNRAEEFRRKHLQRVQEIVKRYVGNYYRFDAGGEPTPENDVFSYIAFMLPELGFSVPSCQVQAKRVQSHAEIADFMETGLRGLIQELPFLPETQDVIRDMLLSYGVMMVGLEPRDTSSSHGRPTPGPIRPFLCRLSPDCLILDPLCEKPEDARYIGHTYWRDIDELEADPQRWDPAVVSQLASQWNEYETDNVSERYLRKPIVGQRDRVNLCDLWIPEHNLLITLSRQGTTGGGVTPLILRQVEWEGPPEGPYEIYGCYRAPGDPYPLGPLQPIMEELEQKWAHQNAAANEAATYKKVILVEANQPDIMKAIQEGKSGDIFPVRALKDAVVQVEVGGSPAGRLEHIADLRDQTDRTIGISDAQRGRVNSKTATANEITESNVDARTAYLRTQVNYHTARVLSRAAWYLFNNPAVVMPVQITNQITGQQTEGMFLGGPQPGQEDVDWVDFYLTIEPTSMQRTDDAMVASRAETLLTLAPQIAQGMLSLPWVNWRYIVDMYGESFNQKHLAELLFNTAMLTQLQQTAAAFGQMDPSMNPTMGAPAGGPGMPGPQGIGMPTQAGQPGNFAGGGPGPQMLQGGAPPGGAPQGAMIGMGGGQMQPPRLPTLGGQGGQRRPFMFLGNNPAPRQRMKRGAGPAPAMKPMGAMPTGPRQKARPAGRKQVLPS